MADLNFRAQLELIDKMTAPMRSLSSQANRLGRQFGETTKQAKQLQGQQRLIDSFRQQSTAVLETSRAYQQNQQRLSQLNAQIKATTAPSKSLIDQFESAQRQSQKLGTRLQSEKQHLSQLKGKLGEAGIATDRLGDHQQQLAQQIEQTNKKIAQQREQMGKMRQLKAQSQNMADMRNKAVGIAMTGAAATYAGARFIQPGVDFEQGMSKVQALTRLDQNSEQYKALEAQARKLGATTQFTQSDAAAGQSFLAMAGFTPENIQKAMPGMLDLALAGGMELDRTADIASNILSGMKIDPKDMGKVSDVLATTFTNSNTDIAMLGETLKYAAPGAEMLGVSLEEVAAMAGKLGDNGIQGSMAGTALRSIMSRLASSKPAQKALNELGVQTKDANGNLREMPDILTEVWRATESMGNAEALGYFKAIAGEEAGNSFKILAEQAANGDLDTLTDKLKNADGGAKALAKTMADNTTGDYKAMQSATDALRTSIFDANRDNIRGFMQGLTGLIQKLTQFANAHPQVISVLGKLFATLAFGAVVFGTIGAAVLSVLGPMALLRASMITLGLPTNMGGLGALIAGFGKFKTLLMGLRFASIFNPLGIAIMVIAGLAFTLIAFWNPIKAFFSGLWSGILEGLAPIKQAFTESFATLAPILAPLRPIFDSLLVGIQSLGAPLNFSSETMMKVSAAGKALGFAIGTLVGWVIKFVGFWIGSWLQIYTSFMAKSNAIITTASSLWARLRAVFGAGITALIAIINRFRPSAIFVRLFTAVWSYFSGLGARFRQYGANIIDGLKQGILGKAQTVISAISSVANRIKSAFTSARAMDIHSPSRVFGKFGGFMMTGLSGGVMKMANAPMKAVQWVADKIKSTPFNIQTLNSHKIHKGLQIASKLPYLQKYKRLINNYLPVNLDTLAGTGRVRSRVGRHSQIVSQPPIRTDSRRTILSSSAMLGNRSIAGSQVTNMGGITINITGASDPHTTAQLVRAEFEKIQLEMNARRRSRYTDID